MEFKNLKYEIEDGIALVTMNRPDVMNALYPETLDSLSALIDMVEKDKSIKALIFTGEGKAFVAGADIESFTHFTPLEGRNNTIKGQVVFARLENLDIPVIAAVNGYALGGGCEFAMACDIRIASEYAKFGQPEVNLGLIPGFGGTQRLPRLIGIGRARYYTFTAEMIPAEEAYRIGLADKVVSADELVSAAKEVAKTITSKAPVAIALAKKTINTGSDLSLDAGIILEAEAFGMVFATEDRVEGTTAFVEKRKASFKGK